VRFQIVRVGMGPGQIADRIPHPDPDLIVHPPSDSRPHMARHARHGSVGGSGPAFIGRRDEMTAGAERRLVGERGRDGDERDRSGDETQYKRARFPAHAPIERVGGNVAR
jgi:hypothetical protein